MEALIVIDMQNDFMPWGALPVPRGDELIPIINELMTKYPLVVATQDWHPINHCSFATQHKGKKIGEVVLIGSIPQLLWPVHSVQNTIGAAFAKGLEINLIDKIFFKGIDPWIDSYSGFFDNAHLRQTGLHSYLILKKVSRIVLVGVATEYCVLYTAIDGLDFQYEVTVLKDACRAINQSSLDGQRALDQIKEKGGKILCSKQIRSC